MDNMQEGIVTAIRIAPDVRNNIYTILSDKVLPAKNTSILELYDKVEMKGVSPTEINTLNVIGKATHNEYEVLIKEHLEKLKIKENVEKLVSHNKEKQYGDALKSMAASLVKASESFARCFFSGAPIIVRFHNDGDGASGAVALNRALIEIQKKYFLSDRNISWVMHHSIDYDKGYFYGDSLSFNSYKSIEKPTIFITDFGTAPSSEDSITECEGKYNLIWLDHHPLYSKFPKDKIPHYINTWDFGSDSNFTAGLLTCLFAETLAKIDTEDMIKASLISDFSSYADRKLEDGQKTAIILDYLTSIAGRRDSSIERLTPNYIESILSDKEKSDAMFFSAFNTLNEILELGVKNVKSYKCKEGITTFVLDFGSLPKGDSAYPLPGRYSSRLQERMESINGPNTVILVHYGSYITVRLSKVISKKVGLLDIIEGLLKLEDYVESGGGHNEAASIKIRKGALKNVLNMLLKELGANLASQ
jgi:RecJ-like exonuclease